MNIKTRPSEITASHRFATLNRRHFLRGLGASLILPTFESLKSFPAFAEGPAGARLATTATGMPLRTAFVFFPNGAIPSAWWPQGDLNESIISDTLRPLEQNRQDIQILGGLDHLCANPGLDGAGDHARATGVFLTGVRLNKSPTEIRAGISIDQAIARETGHLTRLPSLELSCDDIRKAGACDSDYSCAYQYNLSWSSASTPVTPEVNPRLAFERLFGAGAPGSRTENLKRRLSEQRSILDFVFDDARRMEGRLSSSDKDKLDQYLTSIRSIETRIQRTESFGVPIEPDGETPRGIPSDRADYIQLMYDLIAMAFQTDSTRIATFCLAHDGDNRPLNEIGIFQGHHDLSHHSNRPEKIKKVAEIDRWYITQFSKFLRQLQEAKDLDGNSILHNSMILYGGGNADANLHTHTNLPLILAGGGGGLLTPGRYVKHGAKPAANLLLSIADRMGARWERFGDSNAPLANI